MLASLAPVVISAAVALLPHHHAAAVPHHVVRQTPSSTGMPAPARVVAPKPPPITAESPTCDAPNALPGACVVVQLPSERDGREQW